MFHMMASKLAIEDLKEISISVQKEIVALMLFVVRSFLKRDS